MNENRSERFFGVIPVLATPFTTEFEVDLPALDRELEHLQGAGVTWVALGFGSEVHLLADDAIAALTRHVALADPQRLRLIGNVEATGDAQATLQRIEAAARLGSAAIILRPTPAQGNDSATVTASLTATAAASPLPLVIQDAPQHTGVTLSAEDLAALAGHERIAGLKIEPPEGPAKIAGVTKLLGPAAPPIIAGHGAVDLMKDLDAGAEATMPGAGFVPELQQLFHDSRAGRREAATRWWTRLAPLMLLGKRSFATFVQLQKLLLVYRDVLPNDLIAPTLGAYDPQLEREVAAILDVTGGLL